MPRGRPKGTNNITDDLTKYNREYMRANKEKYEYIYKIRIECECNGSYTKNTKSRHFKSLKHKYYMLKNQNQNLNTM